MTRHILVPSLTAIATVMACLGCQSNDVGDVCVPNSEYSPGYQGGSSMSITIDDRSFQCETRVCLGYNFQGRVTCPFGNQLGGSHWTGPGPTDSTGPACTVPGTDTFVSAAVVPQCSDRKDSVYCSCRCDGNDVGANYCKCPTNFTCEEIQSLGVAKVGDKYCVKNADLQDYACPASSGCDVAADTCGYTANTFPQPGK